MLEVRGLSVSYGPVQALSDIALEVREGEITALIGANGAGKSSLIHAVAGLVPAAGGTVAFRGKDVLGLPSHRIFRRGIALCPEGRMVLGGLTVEENLKLAAPKRRSFDDLYELFPRLADRTSSRGALAIGRRGADACHRARAGPGARAAAAGRTLARAGPECGPGHIRAAAATPGPGD